MDDLLYGKDNQEEIVSIEVKNNQLYIYKNDGTFETKPYKYWFLTNRNLGGGQKLLGDNYYKFLYEFKKNGDYFSKLGECKQYGIDRYCEFNLASQAMIRGGYTLFKGLSIDQVSVLSFDIETSGLKLNSDSKVYIITNTFSDGKGNITKKMFSLDEYQNDKFMINDWVRWVRQINPSIIVGHNILGFDLPYLNYCSDNGLRLGRDGSWMQIDKFVRKFRKDGSQSYNFNDVNIFGRQVIDTMFLSIKYDFKREFPSYGLKPIINYLGLEKKNRTFYDAGRINENWDNPEERLKIKEYAKDDADDSLALYNLMIPSFFYYTQSIPMDLQYINNTATGRQINSFLIRSYIQNGFSIPDADQHKRYEGGISFGRPGIYKDVFKVDVTSLYPSIIQTYHIFDINKDPQSNFLKMVTHFTQERIKNKIHAKRSKNNYYNDLSNAQKIMINSAYGVLGASGLNFNSMNNAALVTSKGREILQKGIDWVENSGNRVVNVDTDSFSYTKDRFMDNEERIQDLETINNMMDNGINWEDDGYYDSVLVLKAKNYILYNDNNMVIKGSALKDQKKEPALKELLDNIILSLLNSRDDSLNTYNNYIKELYNIVDIKRWAIKKTVTKAVLNGERLNEIKVRNAIKDEYVREGDKIWLYPAITGYDIEITASGKKKKVPRRELKLIKNWDNDFDVEHGLKRVYDTMIILSNVIDIKLFPKYQLVKNKKLLNELIKEE